MCFGGSRTAGLLGGSNGILGGGVISTVVTFGDDFVVVKDVLLLSASLYPGNALVFSISLYLLSTSSFVRLGGKGGKEAGSNTGALILPVSVEDVLVDDIPVPLDNVDIVEIVEAIDSFEAFRLSCSEGRRGGRAGEGCVDCFLAGNLGGGLEAGFGD